MPAAPGADAADRLAFLLVRELCSHLLTRRAMVPTARKTRLTSRFEDLMLAAPWSARSATAPAPDACLLGLACPGYGERVDSFDTGRLEQLRYQGTSATGSNPEPVAKLAATLIAKAMGLLTPVRRWRA